MKKNILEEHAFKCEIENMYLQFMAANSFIYSAQYTKHTTKTEKKALDSISL